MWESLSIIFAWIGENENVLSGVAALIVILGVLFTPIGGALRRFLTRGPSSAAAAPEQQSAPAPPKASAPAGERATVAVLPFESLTPHPEDDALADGMTEDVITLLSCLPGFHVVSRTSTFAYKGHSGDIRQVAQDLGVRYVVEGTIRRIGDRARIIAKLVDAESGAQLWSERFDREVVDIFDVQDEVTQGIATQLMPQLTSAEAARAAHEPPDNLDAWSYYQRALSVFFFSGLTAEVAKEAERLALRALEYDADFPPALSFLGNVLSTNVIMGWSEDPVAEGERATELGQRAGKLAPDHPAVLYDRGNITATLENPFEGEALLLRSVELNPNNAHAWAVLGYIAIRTRRPDEGAERVMRAIGLSPRDPRLYIWRAYVATARAQQGDWEGVLKEATISTQLFDGFELSWLYRVGALVHLGRDREAQGPAWRFRQLHPDPTEESVTDLMRRTGPGGEVGKALAAAVWPVIDKTRSAPAPLADSAPSKAVSPIRGAG